jgi:hypothetical protein
VVPAPHARGDAAFWKVICRNPPNWFGDQEVQFRNVKHQCYLATGLKGREKETINKFNVTCGRLNKGAVWAAVEGIYFNEELGDDKSDL